MTDINLYLKKQKQLIDRMLVRYLPSRKTTPARLYQAMLYSLKSGGKRLRPILTLETGKMLKAKKNILLPVACAIEFIHTYSLIHDDLPAMDNDDFRRGKPTTHKVFGEDIAILAGDALLTQAFGIIAAKIKDTKLCQCIILEVSLGVGAEGMVGGQALDLYFTKNNKKIGSSQYNKMLQMKTGALIRTAVYCGGIIAKTNNKTLKQLYSYGKKIGLAFQLKDDILDNMAKSKSQTLTKTKLLINNAKSALSPLGKRAKTLKEIADYIVSRTY